MHHLLTLRTTDQNQPHSLQNVIEIPWIRDVIGACGMSLYSCVRPDPRASLSWGTMSGCGVMGWWGHWVPGLGFTRPRQLCTAQECRVLGPWSVALMGGYENEMKIVRSFREHSTRKSGRSSGQYNQVLWNSKSEKFWKKRVYVFYFFPGNMWQT